MNTPIVDILVEFHAAEYFHSAASVFMVVIMITFEPGSILMMNVHTAVVIDVKIAIHKIVVRVVFLNVLPQNHRSSFNSD